MSVLDTIIAVLWRLVVIEALCVGALVVAASPIFAFVVARRRLSRVPF